MTNDQELLQEEELQQEEEVLQDTQPSEEQPREVSPLEALQQEFAKLSDQHLRTLAEYDNYRRRSAKERESIYTDAKAAAFASLLGTLDNFARAMETPCQDEEFKKGMELIYTSLRESLAKQGVEPLGQVGEPFDPLCHNAVMHVEDGAFGENVICEVFQQGYRMGEKILRVAMVKVAN